MSDGDQTPNGRDITLYNEKSRLGDRIFISGSAAPTVPEAKCGNIVFRLGSSQRPNAGAEVLLISEDGFFVNGKRVTEGADVYTAFKRWLANG